MTNSSFDSQLQYALFGKNFKWSNFKAGYNWGLKLPQAVELKLQRDLDLTVNLRHAQASAQDLIQL